MDAELERELNAITQYESDGKEDPAQHDASHHSQQQPMQIGSQRGADDASSSDSESDGNDGHGATGMNVEDDAANGQYVLHSVVCWFCWACSYFAVCTDCSTGYVLPKRARYACCAGSMQSRCDSSCLLHAEAKQQCKCANLNNSAGLAFIPGFCYMSQEEWRRLCSFALPTCLC